MQVLGYIVSQTLVGTGSIVNALKYYYIVTLKAPCYDLPVESLLDV